jgi:NitT/TauT family transport system substrate-binding protein
MKRSIFMGAAAAAAVLPRRANAQTLTQFRATSAIDDSATPYLWAMQTGLFRKNGLDATLERATSGAAAASAVVGGSFEVGKSSVMSLLSAHLAGVPIVAVSAAGEYDHTRPSLSAVVVRPDSAVHSGADLIGKTVAVQALNDSFSLSIRSWIDATGGDSSTVKIIEVPMSSALVALTSGRVDAIDLIQPYLNQALSAGTVRSVGDAVSATGAHHTDSAWFTTIDYAQKNPDTVNRFMNIIRQGAVYVNGHPAETAHFLTDFAKMQSADVSKARQLEGWRLDPAYLQPLIDAAARYKMIPQRFDARDLIYAHALH